VEGQAPDELDFVCASRGPGSFTGLRAGLSCIRSRIKGGGCVRLEPIFGKARGGREPGEAVLGQTGGGP
jgi:hypothetical protein